MRFDFNKYRGKYAMHCKTEEEAKDFCRVMDENGRTLIGGCNYIEFCHIYGVETCYNFNTGQYSSLGYYNHYGYTILEWSDFMVNEFTKADLKEGMVGITREGKRYIYFCGKFRNRDGVSCWGVNTDLNNDFTNRLGNNSSDFMRICISFAESLCNWCDDEYLTTLWERNEVTEMTLDEIKDRLGIKGTLKIVKE